MRAVLLFLLFGAVTVSAETKHSSQKLKCRDRLLLNVYEVVPDGEILGDYFFLEGFGDTATNHLQRAEERAKQGIRTVLYDFPSQGSLDDGPNWYDLNRYTMEDLAAITAELVAARCQDSSRPLFIGG